MNLDDTAGLKKKVQDFWNKNPCESHTSQQPSASRAYFDEVEFHRYRSHVELKDYVGFDRTGGLTVLEIGCGLGTDGRQFVQAGAAYTGVDLTEAAVGMSQANFASHGLDGTFCQADAENLQFRDASFDLVYSFGVLHHTPQMEKAFREVNRVLKPGGRFIVMVYHAHSWNYYVNIMVLRRFGSLLLYFPGGTRLVHALTREPLDRLEHHKRNLQQHGLSYLHKSLFLSQNTDGPGNPLSRVYTRPQLTRILRDCGFVDVTTRIGFLHKRWIPLLGRFITGGLEKKLAARIGWHLYGFARKPAA